MKLLIRSIPLLLTAGNLLCGLGAIFILSAPAVDGEAWRQAAICVFAAWGFDLVDGPMARKLGVESELGKYSDMLADLVSFAVAPALLAVKTLLAPAGVFSHLCAALFVLCGAFRLARFARLTRDRRQLGYFTGMPLPAAAALLCGGALFAAPATPLVQLLQAVGVLLLSGLMVSPLKFPTSRHPSFARSSPILRGLAVAATVLAAFYDVRLLLILFAAYVLAGLLLTVRDWTSRSP